MAYYRRSARSRASGTPRSATTTGALRYEELMGEEGFSSDSSLLYHRGVPSAIVDSQVWELPDQATTPNHPLKPRHLKLHDLFDGPTRRRSTRSSGRRLVLGNGDVRISYVVADRPPRRTTATRSATSACTSRPARGTVETVVRRAVLPHRRLRAGPAGDDAPVGAGRAEPALRRSRPTATSRRRSATCRGYGQLLEHAPYCERDLHGPGEPFLRRGRPTSRCWSSTAAPVRPASSAPG